MSKRFCCRSAFGLGDVRLGGLFSRGRKSLRRSGSDEMVADCAATVAEGCTLSSVASTCPCFHVVAFLRIEVRDAAEGSRTDVDVRLRFDLAGARDRWTSGLRG